MSPSSSYAYSCSCGAPIVFSAPGQQTCVSCGKTHGWSFLPPIPSGGVAKRGGYAAYPQAPQAPPLPQELVAAPVEAWRIWRVERPEQRVLDREALTAMAEAHERGENPFRDLLQPKLAGVGSSHVPAWPRTLHARCESVPFATRSACPGVDPDHVAPHVRCGCGAWGFKTEAAIPEALIQYAFSYIPAARFAYGRVLLWGRMVEHVHGWRAEYARPAELHLIGGDEETAEQLASFYGCSCDVVEMPAEVEARMATVVMHTTAGTSTATSAQWATALGTSALQQAYVQQQANLLPHPSVSMRDRALLLSCAALGSVAFTVLYVLRATGVL